MAKLTNSKDVHNKVSKRTAQGGRKPKTSAMNKTKRRGYKKKRGQGK